MTGVWAWVCWGVVGGISENSDRISWALWSLTLETDSRTAMREADSDCLNDKRYIAADTRLQRAIKQQELPASSSAKEMMNLLYALISPGKAQDEFPRQMSRFDHFWVFLSSCKAISRLDEK